LKCRVIYNTLSKREEAKIKIKLFKLPSYELYAREDAYECDARCTRTCCKTFIKKTWFGKNHMNLIKRVPGFDFDKTIIIDDDPTSYKNYYRENIIVVTRYYGGQCDEFTRLRDDLNKLYKERNGVDTSCKSLLFKYDVGKISDDCRALRHEKVSNMEKDKSDSDKLIRRRNAVKFVDDSRIPTTLQDAKLKSLKRIKKPDYLKSLKET
jgi:hypothetical protein